MNDLTFRGGGSGNFKQTRDSLLTNDTVEVLIGLSEGPIKGPVNGPKSFYADGTQIVSDNGEANFSNFSIDFFPGSDAGDTVTMALGGFASPVAVNTPLAHNVQVTRQGSQTQITAADFRIILNNLSKSDSKGVYADTLSLKFEYKAVSGSTWLPCFTTPPASTTTFNTPDGAQTNWTVNNISNSVASFYGDRPVVQPTAAPTNLAAIGVDNSANVYHWDTGSLTWSQVTTTNGPANSRTFTDYVGNATITRTIFFNQTGTPVANKVGDIWQVGVGQYYMWNGAAWVTPGAYDAAQYQPDPQALANGVWTFTGKVSSATPVNVRVFVPAIGEQYQYRVTKLTTDTTTNQFSVIQWESIEEIKQSGWTFHNLAMTKILGRASDQFTALPQWEQDAEGRIIKVPSNYDPVARTYTGTWDGTYKLAYTNNTAFIFQDFIENTRYGLSSVYPHVVNKWKIYEWGQYCDYPVLKADSTYQPRWTYNDWITQPRDAKEMASYIAATAAALYIDDGNGTVDVMIDKDDAAIALFTPENITPDGFSYTYTDRLTRANEVKVTFVNPLLNGAQDKRLVTNDTDIAAFGRITDDFIAVGCRDVDEALRRARRRLISGMTEKEGVSFTTNRKGKFLSLWNVILISDPDMGRGISGRIHAVTGARSVSLRDAISLEAGFSYQAVFDYPNPAYPGNEVEPFTTVTLNVTNAAGSTTALTFDADLPALLPEYAAFSLQCAGNIGTPKPYRVMALEDDSSNGELVRITAIELNRNKFTYIDTAQDLGTVDYSNFLNQAIDPPTNPQVAVSYRLIGQTQDRVLTLSWDASPSKFVANYEVTWTIDGSPGGSSKTSTLSVDIGGANRGLYNFSIVAVGANGKKSQPVGLIYDVTGSSRVVAPPQNLRLTNGYDATDFSTVDAAFAWDAPAKVDANFSHYLVEVIDGSTVVRSVNVGAHLTWTYDYGSNNTDGLRRTFEVAVSAVDQDGNASPFVTLTATNPPPALTTAVIEENPYVLRLRMTPPPDLDLAGVIVWMTSTTGFTPADGNIVYKDKGNPAIAISPGTTYYFRYAFYDSFGITGLNVSSEQAVTSPKVNFNDIDNLNAQITAAVSAISGDVYTNVALLQTDVSEALRQAGLAGYELVQGALNLQAIKDYVDALTYIKGQPIGVFTLNQVTRTDDLYETSSLLGIKKADKSAFILNTSTVQFDSTGASMASTLNQLNATDATNAANITTESLVRASATTALATTITSLSATVGTNTAAITTEQSVRASADSSLSSSISSVSATVGSLSSSVSTNASAIALATGQLYGTYGIQVRAGNVVTGLTLYSAGGATNFSGIVFDTDYFQIKSSTYPSLTPFLYDATSSTLFLQNVTVRNANIQNASVDTLQIAGNAVSGVVANEVASGTSLTTTSETTDMTFGYTSAGGKIKVDVYGEIGTTTSSAAGAVVKVYIDGVQIGHGNIYCPGSWGGAGVSVPAFGSGFSAGSHTITVTYTKTSGSGACQINRSVIVVTELKR
jgi:predicted phage tail protein